MKAFLTGSRVYGKPTPESDIDLVVFVDPDVRELLAREGGVPTRFGKLNLICVTTHEEYEAWREAKDACHADFKATGLPTKRPSAVYRHKQAFARYGVRYSNQSRPDETDNV